MTKTKGLYNNIKPLVQYLKPHLHDNEINQIVTNFVTMWIELYFIKYWTNGLMPLCNPLVFVILHSLK
jgi:hypothetical protein